MTAITATTPTPGLARTLARICAVYAVLAGGITLLGWWLELPRLTDWIGSGISMLPNTSIAVMIMGVAVLLWVSGHHRIAAVLGALVALIGGATWSQYIFGWDLGIDQLILFKDFGQRATLVPGRMGPPASISFTLLGTGVVLANTVAKGERWASVLGTCCIGVAALSLIGYAFGADNLFSLPHYTGIAMQTCTVLLALSLGMLACMPRTQPVSGLLEDSAAGLLLRRALPVVILLPLLLASLRVVGEQQGLYDSAFGTALRTTVEMLLLAVALWWVARLVRTHERMLRASRAVLQEKTDELSEFLETAAIGLHRVAADGTILWANRAELEMLGYAAEEYIGHHIAEFHVDQHVIDDILGRLHAGEALRDVKAGMRARNGTVKHVLLDSSVLWENGMFKHTRCFTRDVTEQVNAEEGLRLADRRKDEFLATLAHELRNPLAPLSNGLQLVQQNAAREMAEVNAMMHRQMRQMVHLVDDLLDVSRVRLGKINLRWGTTELAAVLRQAAEGVRPGMQQAGQELLQHLPARPVYVNGDVARLVQVVGNLLNNAAKFTSPDGRVELVLAEEQGNAVITVRDNGIGMDPETLKTVFELFVQGDTSLERTTSGLGIGLTLAKNLVELHGGTIEASSEGEGKGSAFVVRLPLVAEAVPQALAKENGARTTATGRKILVVDDNRDAARTLGLILERMGHSVRTVFDGETAFTAATELLPHVILLDIGMPGMNGYEVARRIRAEAWGRGIMLVALTGWGQDEDKRRSTEAGFDHHMVKPPDVAVLNGLVTGLHMQVQALISGKC